MPTCKYCGQSAGLFKSVHKECEERFHLATGRIREAVVAAVMQDQPVSILNAEIEKLAADAYISQSNVKGLIYQGWELAVDSALNDGLVTEDEESALMCIRNHYGLSQSHLDMHRGFTRLAQAVVLRDLSEGILPDRITVNGNVPFNLQKSESYVWFINNVKYYKVTTNRSYAGNSLGVSFRIMKGVYYRPSIFSGKAIDRHSLTHVDTGMLAITNKHIYFGGQTKTFRVAYPKIVAFQPLQDGLGIQRDTANAKMEYFECGDGWFIYNLVTNLAELQL